jgi:multisubunit Na+/H+ antiporter MnhB subunit
MFVWRNALILGVAFIVIGLAYWYVQSHPGVIDLAGATMLVMLGLAMAFCFSILLRGSREL